MFGPTTVLVSALESDPLRDSVAAPWPAHQLPPQQRQEAHGHSLALLGFRRCARAG